VSLLTVLSSDKLAFYKGLHSVVHCMNHVSRLNVLLQIKNEVVRRQTIWKMKSIHLTAAGLSATAILVS